MKVNEIADNLIKYFKHDDDKIWITEQGFKDQIFMDMWHSLSDIHMDDDHKIMFAYKFLSDLSNNNIDYIDDVMDYAIDDVSIYTSDLTSFLCADDNNLYYLTKAIREPEYPLEDGFDALKTAEIFARRDVYQAIAHFINNIADNIDEEEIDDNSSDKK